MLDPKRIFMNYLNIFVIKVKNIRLSLIRLLANQFTFVKILLLVSVALIKQFYQNLMRR